MKKKMLVISCCAMLLALSTTAYAAEGSPYIRGDFGFAVLSDAQAIYSDEDPLTTNFYYESDTGLAVDAALGYDFNGARVEGEIAYQRNALDQITETGTKMTGYTDSIAFMINAYWDFKNASLWTPFMGGGLGVALVNMSDVDATHYLTDDYDSVFAYQVGAGVGYAMAKQVTLDLTYRYFATTDPEFSAARIETEYASNNLYIGLRYNF